MSRLEWSTYRAWINMRQRCRNPNYTTYTNYGGRGITICVRWNTFASFLKDMGVKPTTNHSLDRVNNDGNYEPENCRWVLRDEQDYNRRDNYRNTLSSKTTKQQQTKTNKTTIENTK